MKIIPDNLLARRGTGIYVGPGAIVAATSSRTGHSWNVDSVSTQIHTVQERHLTSFKNIDLITEELTKLLEKHTVLNEVNVAFDDRYVRFFMLPLNERPNKNEVDNILRWHSEKVLRNPKEYIYTSQLIVAKRGFRIFGVAIRGSIINAIDNVLRKNSHPWLLADSAARYIWNSLEEQQKQGVSVLLSLGQFGWTLIASDESGAVELIKPGHWTYDEDGVALFKNGLIEANRLLTTFVDKYPQAKPENVYVDAGEFSDAIAVAQDIFCEFQVVEQHWSAPPDLSKILPDKYTHEVSIAIKASLQR